MRTYIVIAMGCVGLGITIGTAMGYPYGIGAGLMLGAFGLLLNNAWRGWTGTV